MSKKSYGELEQHIIDVFNRDHIFTYQKKLYEVQTVGKPRPQGTGGECKTDVFVRAKEQGTENVEDIKISIKKNNKEFLGNKLKSEDLEAYMGPGWENVVIEATESIKDRFESAPLLYATRKYPTCKNSITVGWKLEITDRERNLSVPIPLTEKQVRDYVYKGTNLSQEKKDSCINGTIIEESGVADYIITTTKEEINCANDVIEQMEDIDTADIGDAYFAFTANNYRTDVDKADGPRSLAVRVEWDCIDKKLTPSFHYDKPLAYTGEGDMAPLVKKALSSLGKHNIDELEENVDVDYMIWKK